MSGANSIKSFPVHVRTVKNVEEAMDFVKRRKEVLVFSVPKDPDNNTIRICKPSSVRRHDGTTAYSEFPIYFHNDPNKCLTPSGFSSTDVGKEVVLYKRYTDWSGQHWVKDFLFQY